MFLDWIKFVAEDVRLTITSLQLRDFAYPSYVLLWLIILFFPLTGVDREDPIAGLVYILYCLAAGATFVFALPGNLPDLSDSSIHIAVLSLMGVLSSYRWFHRNSQTLTKEEHEALERKRRGNAK